MMGLASSGWAAVRTWDNDAGSADRTWLNATNWSANTLPSFGSNDGFSGDDAAINDATKSSSLNPVLIDGTATAKSLTIGSGVTDAGYLEIIASGSLATNAQGGSTVIGGLGIGSIKQTGGTVSFQHNFADVVLGQGSTGVGSYSLSGGSFSTNVSTNAMKVGDAGTGTFTQTGGTVSLTTGFILGNGATGNGTYAMSGSGALTVNTNQQLTVGGSGTGTFTLAGNTVTCGGTNGTILVGKGGKIQGYGTFNYSNTAQGSFVMLTTNGKVIADGSGTDRTLSFVAGGAFGTANQLTANTVENTTNNGWYAQNHGKLTLSKISAGVNGAGAKSVTFAESAGDAVLDLVNSARFNYSATGQVNVLADVSLLAADRTDIAAAPTNVQFIGIWTLSAGSISGFSLPSYQFRYDDLAAAGNAPTLYRLNGGSWTVLTGTDDTTNHILSTTDSGITGFNNTFAIGVAVPEPASLAVLGTSAVLLMGRRRRRA